MTPEGVPSRVNNILGVESGRSLSASRVLGPLVILGLVKIIPPQGEWSELVYLTELGPLSCVSCGRDRGKSRHGDFRGNQTLAQNEFLGGSVAYVSSAISS